MRSMLVALLENIILFLAKYLCRYVKALIFKMVQAKKKSLNIPQLQSVNRITNFPIVETGLNYAENVYQKIKRSNSLFNWTLVQAETTLYAVVDSAAPAVILLQRPLSQVDKIVCKSLDFVEEKIPSINLPPEMIYWNTKQYAKDAVSTKIVRPVLKRADSVKEIGNAVLASKYTAFAADTLDGALNVADKYVDRYLPAAEDDKSVDEVDGGVSEGPAGKAIHTIHHVDRLGRKLKRRLTKKTLAEVKALKEHSAEAVHVLIYVAELVATDPKLALKKGKELWSSLSQDEPENQARPENLEQLIVLLTRESARRVVHLVNFSTSVINRVNKNLAHSVLTLVTTFLDAADSMVKTAHLERAQQSTSDLIRSKAHSATIMLKNLNIQLTDILDNWAKQLDNKQESEHPKTVLSVPQIKVQQLKAFHTNIIKDRNGIENNSNQTASSS
ncbi:lipid storage droplets surface-binding protein 1-like isoform X2 [Cylas formicarius]|uniref:lipid storage droplets surface-binding protein 1-like isoform X2 n=2 Tax=Cylas formicarius TaxID=197179 RepID=UPI0029585D21|nr:lipid storage droplets surface-binding protein 1-like isoform X2 [Cylas formicarius]